MILLGLILIVVAVGIGTLLVLATQPLTEPVALEAAGLQVSVLPLALLIAGAAVLLLFWLGLVMIRSSVRRKARRRRETKELQRQAELDAQARRDEEARREAAERREAEARPAAAPVPAQTSTDSRPGSDDDWGTESGTRHHRDTSSDTAVMESAPPVTADDRSTGRHASDVGVDSRPEAESSSEAGSARQPSPRTTAVNRDATATESASDSSPTVADRVMGRDTTRGTTDTTDTHRD